jgi:hypothetical protein
MIEVFHNLYFNSVFGHPFITATLSDRFEQVAHSCGIATTIDGAVSVAKVQTDNLDRAFELTNHIDSPWPTNSGVVLTGLNKDLRSTSVGDILVNHDTNEAFLVAPFGFISYAQYREELESRLSNLNPDEKETRHDDIVKEIRRLKQ